MATSPKLRPLSKEEDIAAIPKDQPVLIQLPSAPSNTEPGEKTPQQQTQQQEPPKPQDDPAKALREQLETMQRAKDAEISRLRQEAQDARERAQRAEQTGADAQQRAATDGLAKAKADIAAAKQAFKIASEAGDFAAAADAQEKIGRASAEVLHYEGVAAELGQRKTEQQTQPTQRTDQQQDMMAAMRASPNLLAAEKTWFEAHPEALIDTRMNRRLEVAYDKAMEKGLSRGTPAYMTFIDEQMGYKAPEQQQTRQDDGADDQDGSTMAAAPVSRGNSSMSTGNTRPGEVILTPEERDFCASSGISEVEYAKGKVAYAQAKKADPEKYFVPAQYR